MAAADERGDAGGPGARRVLVTGAAGLVGRRVVEQLAAGDIDVIVALDLRAATTPAARPNVIERCGDIRDPELHALFAAHRIDTVVHLAAVVTPGPRSSRELEYSIDVLGTENVLRACLRAGVARLVYTSSGAAYGYHADNPPLLRESDPLRGNAEFAYAHHKRLVEEMLARARREHPELRQLVFRPGTILGERVASPITALFERPILVGVCGSPAPFVLVWDEDVARGIVQGIGERWTGTYNLAGDGAISLRQIARRLGKPYLAVPAPLLRAALWLAHACGLSARGAEQVEFLQYRPVLSNQLLKAERGFAPRYSSEECFEHYRRAVLGGAAEPA